MYLRKRVLFKTQDTRTFTFVKYIDSTEYLHFFFKSPISNLNVLLLNKFLKHFCLLIFSIMLRISKNFLIRKRFLNFGFVTSNSYLARLKKVQPKYLKTNFISLQGFFRNGFLNNRTKLVIPKKCTLIFSSFFRLSIFKKF